MNRSLEEIEIENMPTLSEVCVWSTPFPPAGVQVKKAGSPNVYFKDCVAPVLTLIPAPDSLFQPTHINAGSSENGMVYLTTEITVHDLALLRSYSLDSVQVTANSTSEINLTELENGVYYLYAADLSGNVSEPEAFSIYGVGNQKYNQYNVIVFPNPAKEVIMIQVAKEGIYDIEFSDLSGKRICTDRLSGSAFQLDISSFNSGIYILKLRCDETLVIRKISKL
jgi:hypothetical protein